jgi:hypothetical protein
VLRVDDPPDLNVGYDNACAVTFSAASEYITSRIADNRASAEVCHIFH